MRKLTLFSTVFVLLANLAWIDQIHAQWPQATAKNPRFSAEFGIKGYDRPGDELMLPLITNGDTGATLFNSEQATDLGTAVGAEVKFNFESGYGRELEFRMILADWDENVFTVDGTSLQSPFFPTPGAEPTTVTYGYESDYFSAELMARRSIKPGITIMAGPRIVSTKDQVNIGGSLVVDPLDGSPPVTVTQTSRTEATNILIGLQTGFEFNFPVTRDMHLNSYIRAGGYMNPTEVNQTSFDTINTTPVTTRNSKSTGSFLGEIGARLYVDIIPDTFSAYVGYEANWIDGIALAPAQLLTTDADGVQTGNTPFFNGVTFGAQVHY